MFVFKNTTTISVPEYDFHVTEKNNNIFSYLCYHLSSLLLLVGDRDDSNRDDKKYANSHLLCFLEAKTYICLHSNNDAYIHIMIHVQCLNIILISAFCSSKKVGNRDDI